MDDCIPSHPSCVRQCLSRQTVLDPTIPQGLFGGSIEALLDTIQSKLASGGDGPHLGAALECQWHFFRTPGLELLEIGYRSCKRKLAAVLANYVGKYVFNKLEALDIYYMLSSEST